jgi:hypothetical protein
MRLFWNMPEAMDAVDKVAAAIEDSDPQREEKVARAEGVTGSKLATTCPVVERATVPC